MMRVGLFAATHQASLLGDKAKVFLVAIATWAATVRTLLSVPLTRSRSATSVVTVA